MTRWLRSAPFDLAFIVAPALVPALAVLLVPALRGRDLPPWAFLFAVVGVDVAHVWSSVYRTYLDPDERRRRGRRYLLTPVLCFAAGVALWWAGGGQAFWRVLAYLAVFHFVRQQYGLMMLYRARAGERGRADALVDKLAIYSTMLYPLAWWHATPGRAYDWFVDGDFVSLPAGTKTVALVLYAAAMATFALRQAQRALTGLPINLPKVLLVGATAVSWYVGIVLFDSDLAFTLTNTLAHGIPYVALVWLYGHRKWRRRGGLLAFVHGARVAPLAAFWGLLIAVAWLEEGAWDRWVWNEHPGLFAGLSDGAAVTGGLLALVVPLLAVPQATHYVLDAWIWKLDGSNPDLREHLLTS